ncbi:MAG: hypothetical protein WCB69_16385 [Pseudolabrys sp.]
MARESKHERLAAQFANRLDGVARFGFTYLLAAGICGFVTALAKGERARAFKAISPGMLPPLGIIFGLFVAFTAAQVWSDNERANVAVDREASALRAVVVLAATFPGEPESHFRALIRRHIDQAATQEWPMMAQGTATLRFTPPLLAEALQLTLALTPNSEGQKTAQREIATALETAFDARRQRIFAIAMIHCDNRIAAAITVGLFATGVAASVLLIAAHDRPFTGEISVGPGPLLQVMPDDSR